jgi:hypothetical protein
MQLSCHAVMICAKDTWPKKTLPSKQNNIKCFECKKEQTIKRSNGRFIKSNDLVKKQLDELVYLSDEEVSLKK